MQSSDKVSITLEQRQWNDVLDVLHDAKYRVAAPIIAAIVGQYNLLLAAEATPPVEAAPAQDAQPIKTNGTAEPAPISH